MPSLRAAPMADSWRGMRCRSFWISALALGYRNPSTTDTGVYNPQWSDAGSHTQEEGRFVKTLAIPEPHNEYPSAGIGCRPMCVAGNPTAWICLGSPCGGHANCDGHHRITKSPTERTSKKPVRGCFPGYNLKFAPYVRQLSDFKHALPV